MTWNEIVLLKINHSFLGVQHPSLTKFSFAEFWRWGCDNTCDPPPFKFVDDFDCYHIFCFIVFLFTDGLRCTIPFSTFIWLFLYCCAVIDNFFGFYLSFSSLVMARGLWLFLLISKRIELTWFSTLLLWNSMGSFPVFVFFFNFPVIMLRWFSC